jgi:hypothetical protein
MWREIFSYTVTPEVFLDEANLRDLIQDTSDEWDQDEKSSDFEDAVRCLLRDTNERTDALSHLIATFYDDEVRSIARREILIQSAPLASALGAWLQGHSTPSLFEDARQLKLLTLLADDVGVGRPEASRTDAFRSIVRRAGLSVYAGQPDDLVALQYIRDPMFKLPGLLFGLSRRSEAFGPELAGIDYALRSIGMCPAWRILSACSKDESEWTRLDLSIAHTRVLRGGPTPRDLSQSIARSYNSDAHAAGRVRGGVWWLAHWLSSWSHSLVELITTAIDPRLAMSVLIKERAREASLYHSSYMLEGTSLAGWFKRAQSDPLALVDALARSELIQPGAPNESALIRLIVRPSGPMFRIFDEEDVSLIRRWIASLANSGLGKQTEAQQSSLSLNVPTFERRIIRGGDGTLGRVPTSIRDSYLLLQGRAIPPRTRRFALDYTEFWLGAARRSVDLTQRSLPPDWTPGCIRTWLLDSHERSSKAFEQSLGEDIPSRPEIIEQTLQLAPLTLIDGAWLQGFTEVSLATTRVGYPLFSIYWDELGNGDWKINHPKIFRDLLAAMDINLPPTGSVDFANDSRLKENSFRLAVFWLCLGKFPITLKPEILGMNLAMELSGVGGTYRSAQRYLKQYGFPTLFIDIHNTIDNVSSGHSAWAADAIDAHLLAKRDVADIEWERVRVGYESLAPLSKHPDELDYFRRRNKIGSGVGFQGNSGYNSCAAVPRHDVQNA